MKKRMAIVFLAGLVLALAGTVQVNAQWQGPQAQPPTPQMLDEIRSTHGAALLKYYPQYTGILIPVVGGVRTTRFMTSPTQKMIEEINATRGAALLKYLNK